MPTIRLSQGSTHPPLEATLNDAEGDPLPLDDASAVKFEMSQPGDDPPIRGHASITNGKAGRVQYQWDRGDTDTVGTHNARFHVRFKDGSTTGVPSGRDALAVTITPAP